MNALINKWYWCIFASMSLVLLLSVSGLLAVWLWPASPPPKYFVVPKLTDPKFTFSRHLLVNATTDTWDWSEEEEVPPETGRKILSLLRGSSTWAAVWERYHRDHPEDRVMCRLFDHSLHHSLAAYEGDSTRPSLRVSFESGNRVWVNDDLYVVRPSRLSELRGLLAGLDGTAVREQDAAE